MPKEKSTTSIEYPEVKVKDVAKTVWQGIKPEKGWLFSLVGSIILANILAIVSPLFYEQFFNVLASGGNPTALAPQLIRIIFYVLAINAVLWIFNRGADVSNNFFEPRVMANLKQDSYDYLMQHSYSFFTGSFAGSLVQKVNRLARGFERLTDNVLWNLLPLVVRVAAILIIVFFVNRWIDLIIFIWLTIFLSFNFFFARWKLKYDLKAAAIDSKATGYLADTISNQNNVQLFNGFPFESAAYKKVTDEQSGTTTFAWNLDAIVNGMQAFFSVAIEFILFYVAVYYWKQGTISLGVFVLLQAYVLNIINQLWGFSRIVRDTYQSYADAKEMVEIRLLPHEINDRRNAKDLKVKTGEIEFKDVSFAFQQTRMVLDKINLTIRPGEKIALIGPSGAGKTTLVRLLLRLYEPASGKILIDGQDIAQASQESLRKAISLVPQDPILFHRTLAENISYGKRGTSKRQISIAAKAAHCDEFISQLPLGFDTFVGERGIKLSGGERQRVAIARAILKNSPILILDEATSSLDSNSELLIQDALEKLMEGKTAIVIAHRLSTIQKMDRIVVVDNQNIVEQGTHAELLQKENSLYRKLWQLQAGGFIAANDPEEETTDEEMSDDENEEEVE
jgi:ATP-binding cassette subfamily B protein